MNITVILPESRVAVVKNGLESSKGVGLNFEYCSNFFDVFTAIKDRGFYMDKLVIIAAVLADVQPAIKQSFVDNLINICEDYLSKGIGEIMIVDSGKLIEVEYHRFFAPYPKFVYQTQHIYPSQLMSLIAGNVENQENANIDNEVKKPSFFSRILGKRKNAQAAQSTQSDAPIEEQAPLDPLAAQTAAAQPQFSTVPLFADTTAPQPTVPAESQESQSLLEESDLDALFGPSEPVSEHIAEVSQPAYSDTPLFTDEQPQQEIEPPVEPAMPQQSVEQAIPQSVEQPQQPQQQTFSQPQQQTFSQPQQPTFSQPQQQTFSQPQQQTFSQPQPSSVPTYVNFFRKRSKTILFTGDRRSGVSTVVSNMAEQASQDGLAVLILDLDHDRRGQACNFPIECDPNDIRMTLSLYNAIKNASNIDEYAIHLNDNLSMLGTSLIANESAVMHKHVTDEALRPLLSMAMGDYDLILIDCPFEKVKEYTCLVAMSNYVVHCMHTDTRAVLDTINLLTPDMFSNNTDYTVYMSKMLILLTAFRSHFWNNMEVNESTVTSYMAALTDDQMYLSLAVMGRLPEFADYDYYMSDGRLLTMNPNYVGHFVGLWNTIAEKG